MGHRFLTPTKRSRQLHILMTCDREQALVVFCFTKSETEARGILAPLPDPEVQRMWEE